MIVSRVPTLVEIALEFAHEVRTLHAREVVMIKEIVGLTAPGSIEDLYAEGIVIGALIAAGRKPFTLPYVTRPSKETGECDE